MFFNSTNPILTPLGKKGEKQHNSIFFSQNQLSLGPQLKSKIKNFRPNEYIICQVFSSVFWREFEVKETHFVCKLRRVPAEFSLSPFFEIWCSRILESANENWVDIFYFKSEPEFWLFFKFFSKSRPDLQVIGFSDSF